MQGSCFIRGGKSWAASTEHGSSKALQNQRILFAGSSSEGNCVGLGEVIQIFQSENASPWYTSYISTPPIQIPVLCRSKSRVIPVLNGLNLNGLSSSFKFPVIPILKWTHVLGDPFYCTCRDLWLWLLFVIQVVPLLRHPVMAKIPRVPRALQSQDKTWGSTQRTLKAKQEPKIASSSQSSHCGEFSLAMGRLERTSLLKGWNTEEYL